jgi:hypothetical protein
MICVPTISTLFNWPKETIILRVERVEKHILSSYSSVRSMATWSPDLKTGPTNKSSFKRRPT